MFKKGMFRRIGQVLSSKWAVSLLGLLAISVLIWFGGPLVAIAGAEPLASSVSRLSVLLLLALIWGMVNIFHLARKKQQNEKAVQSLLDGNDDSAMADEASQREIDTLRDRIVQAMSVLNSSSRGKNVYQLPWYILIGPPGTGKTTALHNSGLEFPLKDQLGNDPLAGVGGTRHCDWWFTNQAVLIDTAGRYTTQDSNSEQDARAWLGFLGLLKKYRTRRPINGAIVTVSLVSLLTQTRTERNLHARAIKQRIQELKNQLGMHFPVYVVMTKADLVAGFSEYFSDLTPDQREQVWGITFPEHAADAERGVVGMFNKEFHHLLERLVSRMNDRMQQTRDIDKRTLIYEFPKQLRLIQSAADDFLKEIFVPNSFEEAPMLRGVYIASATQEGVPIDRVMAETSGSLGLGQVPLKQPGGETNGYFIKRLFEDVIFPEQYIGSVNRHHQKQNLWLRRGVLATSCAAMVAMGALWFTSYSWNKSLVDDASVAVATYQEIVAPELTPDTDVITLTQALNALRDLPAGYSGNKINEEAFKHAGLYQGEKLGQPAVAAYDRGLQGYLAPFLLNAMHDDMTANREHLEYLYETLKAYLMLFDEEKYDESQVLSWFSLYFDRTFPGDINLSLRESLMAHTVNLLKAGLNGVTQDEDVILAARHELTNMSLAERAYQRLKVEFSKSNVPDFRITDLLGAHSRKIFQRASGVPLSEGIPSLYTYSGFHTVFLLETQRIVKRLTEDSWVYGDKIDLGDGTRDEVIKEVSEKYYRDYVYVWEALLADLELIPYRNVDAGLYQARVLSGSEQPVQTLIVGLQKQLRLTALPMSNNAKAATEVAGSVASVALAQKKNNINRYLPNDMPEIDIDLPGQPVEEAFTELLSVGEVELLALKEAFTMLHNHLVNISNSEKAEKIAYRSLLSGDKQASFNGSMTQAKHALPAPFTLWIDDITMQTSKLAKQGSKVQLNTLWKNTVVRQYRSSIAGKYPFSEGAVKEVKMKDFGDFFGHGGVMDSFFDQHLSSFVDTSKRRWRFTKNMGLSDQSLVVFQRARRIRDAFFPSGSKQANVEFGLTPVSLDKHISNFKFEFGDQEMIYRHEPPRMTTFSWPDRSQSTPIRLVFTPPRSGHSITKNYPGSWGLFRLLDNAAKQRPKTRSDKLINLEHKGNRVTLKLLPNSVTNPFWLDDIERFGVPEKL
ncbi:type VI secretion system membrane subunit TssM [Photobacterium japonica]|uniref:type VI secretion system membrane subunit TssM n=1 Tax=Photobacterium japonica TaxID=2910235 RepID=UPI003D0CA8B7